MTSPTQNNSAAQAKEATDGYATLTPERAASLTTQSPEHRPVRVHPA